jgi:hypothetical protein
MTSLDSAGDGVLKMDAAGRMSAVGQSVPPPVELTGFKMYHL